MLQVTERKTFIMLDSEDEDPHVKGLNGGLQGRE